MVGPACLSLATSSVRSIREGLFPSRGQVTTEFTWWDQTHFSSSKDLESDLFLKMPYAGRNLPREIGVCFCPLRGPCISSSIMCLTLGDLLLIFLENVIVWKPPSMEHVMSSFCYLGKNLHQQYFAPLPWQLCVYACPRGCSQRGTHDRLSIVNPVSDLKDKDILRTLKWPLKRIKQFSL